MGGKCSFFLVFLAIFLGGCSQKTKPLTFEEREKITAFWEELLLEHGGAYTLFHSKPMTVEPLVDHSPEAEKKLADFLNEHPEIETIFVERKLEEGWEVWKQRVPCPLSSKYALSEVWVGETDFLVFANTEKTLEVLNKHYADFQRVVRKEFDPQKVVEDLCFRKGDFWKQVLLDSTCLGLLLGYGKNNAQLFTERMQKGNLEMGEPSENNDPRQKAACYFRGRPFYLPLFVMLDEAESRALVEQYKKERKKIKEHYRGKDFLEETLAQLRR